MACNPVSPSGRVSDSQSANASWYFLNSDGDPIGTASASTNFPGK
ncbi:MAG: hypothetical protein Ct9H300mP1_21600 [Planctomycetaceae bacterium]|nr:MAG: hypothetical protein Ct9H300mP1_21600 [Planctomycetaceae bacterium]